MPTRSLLAAVLGLSAACGSPDSFARNRDVLAAAEQNLAEARFEAAQERLEALLAETAAEARKYTLQRFFAAVLLTRAHLDASMRGPFLTEPSGTRAGVRKPSWISHTVAATYSSSFAEAWAPAARKAPATEGGQKLLPEDLEAAGVPSSLEFLELARLIASSRLRFQEGVATILEERPELARLAAVEEAMGASGLDAEVQPWVLYGIFDYLKRRDEPRAYRFGIRARELAADSASAREARLGQLVVNWILHESSYVFESSRGVPFDPSLPGDPDANQLNGDYLARKKDAP